MRRAEWLSPLELEDGPVGRVRAALLTTFDPPDADLFVEELLPRWFRLQREPSDDQQEQKAYLAELITALEAVAGHFHVFSSRPKKGSIGSHWLWSHINRHHIGVKPTAIQHAKLWLLHREEAGKDDTEWLEIWISSLNLTRDALRGQIQSAWRCCVPLQPNASSTNRDSWGPLVDFLGELGSQSGTDANAAGERFIRLLSHAQCPPRIAFVPSVPGKHKNGRWGAPGLAAEVAGRGAMTVDVLVPTVGTWSSEAWKFWAEAIGTRTDRIAIAWPTVDHPWAAAWQLPKKSWQTFEKASTQKLAWPLPNEKRATPALHKEHSVGDSRWLHGKCYWIERAGRTRVLVTSANLSPSAWGRSTTGGLYIRNFELGVLFQTERRFFKVLKPFQGQPRFSQQQEDDEEASGRSRWLAAAFANDVLKLETSGEQPPSAKVTVEFADGKRATLRVRWHELADRWQASVKIKGDLPRSVSLEDEDVMIPVIDHRPLELMRSEPMALPDGMTNDDMARLRVRLLEERYGRCINAQPAESVGDELSNQGLADQTNYAGTGSRSYRLEVMEEARRLFGVVDGWRAERAQAGKWRRPFVDADGKTLLASWQRQVEHGEQRSVAYRVAADELESVLGD